MRIVLDANIFLSDLSLRSQKLRLLVEYAERTESTICVPDVVLREVEAHVGRLAEGHLAAIGSAYDFLEQAAEQAEERPKLLSPQDIASQFIKRLKLRYHISERSILTASPAHLIELVERATKRLKPLSDRGEGFRDGLIWLEILDLIRAGGDQAEPVIFISSNSRDFGAEDQLHKALHDDVTSVHGRLEYYSSLDSFLKKHAEKIAFITTEFVHELLDPDFLAREVIAMDSMRSRPPIRRWFARRYSGIPEKAAVTSLELGLEDFYVYPGQAATSWTVIANYSGVAEVEGEVYGPDDYPPEVATGRVHVFVQVEMSVVDHELTEWEIVQVDPDGG